MSMSERDIGIRQENMLRSHSIGYDNGVYTAVEIITDTFNRWRLDSKLHLGLGDVRVTIGMVEELVKEIQEY